MSEGHDTECVVGDGEFLLRYLSERDEACPMCEYNLRGLTGQLCPECGEEIRLRVSLAEPKMGLYLFGLIGWATGLGFGAFVLCYFLFMQFTQRYSPPLVESWSLWLQVTVEGAAVWFWIRRGKWIRRRGEGVRRAFAVVAWTVSVAFAITFFAIVD